MAFFIRLIPCGVVYAVLALMGRPVDRNWIWPALGWAIGTFAASMAPRPETRFGVVGYQTQQAGVIAAAMNGLAIICAVAGFVLAFVAPLGR